MKFLIIFAIVAVLLNEVICYYDDDSCQVDADCKRDECCTKSYLPGKRSKVCKDMGDEVYERCGGEYQCNTCDKGLVCVPDVKSVWNRFLKGTGSCQVGTRPYNRY